MVAPRGSMFRLLLRGIAPMGNMVSFQKEHGCSLGEHVYMLPLNVFPWGTIMFESLCEHNFSM
jgi:hypothetical protein